MTNISKANPDVFRLCLEIKQLVKQDYYINKNKIRKIFDEINYKNLNWEDVISILTSSHMNFSMDQLEYILLVLKIQKLTPEFLLLYVQYDSEVSKK